MHHRQKKNKDSDWQPLQTKKGEAIADQDTYRTVHSIGDYKESFILIIQRTRLKGQQELVLENESSTEEITKEGYCYRAIATNKNDLSNSDIVHWYNQRAKDSENRLKELKRDFDGDTLPCSNFNANALYFVLSTLFYNLFALMRQLLQEELSHHRVMIIRWRLYAMAAKVVKTARQFFVEVQQKNYSLIEQVLTALRRFEPPPMKRVTFAQFSRF